MGLYLKPPVALRRAPAEQSEIPGLTEFDSFLKAVEESVNLGRNTRFLGFSAYKGLCLAAGSRVLKLLKQLSLSV